METKVITIWAYGTFAKLAKEGVKQFKNDINSDANFEICEFNSFEINERLEHAFQTNTELPNIVLLDLFELRYILKKYPNRIMSLDSTLDFSDFISYSVEQVTANERIYGVPCAMEPVALYCKWAAFESAGVTGNTNLTWQDVINITDFLGTENKYFMSYIDTLPEILLQSSGHYFYDDSDCFTSDGVRETFEMIECLSDSGVFSPYNDIYYDSLEQSDVTAAISYSGLISKIESMNEGIDPVFWRVMEIPKNDFFHNDVCVGGYAWVVFAPETQDEFKNVTDFVNFAFISNTELDLLLAENNYVPVKNSTLSNLASLIGNAYFGGQNVIL